MYGMKKDRLRLEPHDPAWQHDFREEKRRIAAALQDQTVRIEHVGSTSIPTVYAKPILDIAILCSKQGIAPMAHVLEKLGYDYRGLYGNDSGYYYAVLDRDDVRLCQVHIYSTPCADWHAKLHFRNVLRTHSELAREYSDYKRGLAEVVSDKSEYARIKTLWVDTFILKVLSVSPMNPH